MAASPRHARPRRPRRPLDFRRESHPPNAMLRDTVTPTMLQAGIRQNVVPSEARGVVNVRLLPGNQARSARLGKLRQLVNDPAVRIEVEPGGGEASPSSSQTTELYAAITRVAGQNSQPRPVLPMMSTGFSDFLELRMRNVQAYGLVPFPDDRMTTGAAFTVTTSESSSRLFRKGIDFLYAIVTEFAVSK